MDTRREYHLWVNDKSLTQVLQKHRDNLDPNIVIEEPVTIVGKTRGIVDLMLSRSVRRHRADDIEHLIVELKAPSVSIGDKETTQTIKYAMAVAADERFKTVPGVRWHFLGHLEPDDRVHQSHDPGWSGSKPPTCL